MKAVYTEEEAFGEYREELARIDRNLVDNIRVGKINPIRGWRILKGMDQKTLAELTGISQPNLCRMEKAGAPTPKVLTLRNIASALDVSIADLIHEP